MKNLNVGFSGSRKGMTDFQKEKFKKVILALKPDFFHHGNCIGADEDAVKIVNEIGKIVIIAHPPINTTYTSKCISDVSLRPREYLDRNKDIVNNSHSMIFAPNTFEEVKRSGTWATYRYSKKKYLMTRHMLYPGENNVF